MRSRCIPETPHSSITEKAAFLLLLGDGDALQAVGGVLRRVRVEAEVEAPQKLDESHLNLPPGQTLKGRVEAVLFLTGKAIFPVPGQLLFVLPLQIRLFLRMFTASHRT